MKHTHSIGVVGKRQVGLLSVTNKQTDRHTTEKDDEKNLYLELKKHQQKKLPRAKRQSTIAQQFKLPRARVSAPTSKISRADQADV